MLCNHPYMHAGNLELRTGGWRLCAQDMINTSDGCCRESLHFDRKLDRYMEAEVVESRQNDGS